MPATRAPRTARTPKPATEPTAATPLWGRLGRPVQVLVVVLILAGVVVIVNGASSLIANVVSVLLLFVFAAVLALVVSPLIDRLERIPGLRGHRGVATLLFWLAVLGALGGAGAFLIPKLVDEAHNLPQLADRVQGELDRRGLHVDLHSLPKAGGGFDLTAAFGIVSSVLGRVLDTVLVAIVSIYLTIEGRELVASMRRLAPGHERGFDFAVLATGSTMGAYVRGQLLMSTLMGGYTALALTLIGVHYALVIGAAAFILEFVPILGTIVSMTIAVGVALLQGPGPAILTAGVGLVGHSLDAYLVGPRVNGRVVKLHPLVAMAALLLGAQVAGVLGALFAVPVAAVINIFLGAFYRSRQGLEAMSTGADGRVDVDNLPRLGDEISVTSDEGIVAEPVPHVRS